MSATVPRPSHTLKGGDMIATTDRTLRHLARTGAIARADAPVEVFDTRPAARSGETIVRLIIGGEARPFIFAGDVALEG
jgi:hypothetical protein